MGKEISRNLEKQCRHCGVVKDLRLFTTNRTAKSGIGAHCLDCERARGRLKRKRTPLAARNSILKHKYGITLDTYNAILADQQEVCKICKLRPPDGGILYVDHCHTTGAVRGLLCHNCNTGLGMFKDDILTLYQAVRYLQAATYKQPPDE